MSTITLDVDTITGRFPHTVLEPTKLADEATVTVPPGELISLLSFLRDTPEWRFNHLADVTSVDMSRYPGRAAGGGALHDGVSALFDRNRETTAH